MADFALLESQKLISRKIWMVETSWKFHTVRPNFPYINLTQYQSTEIFRHNNKCFTYLEAFFTVYPNFSHTTMSMANFEHTWEIWETILS